MNWAHVHGNSGSYLNVDVALKGIEVVNIASVWSQSGLFVVVNFGSAFDLC